MVSEVLRTDIPNDWNVITLGDYAQIFRGGSPRPIQAFLTTSDQGINWIKIGDVGAGEKFIETTEEKIIPEGVSRSRMVYKGDLILSNSMSYGRPFTIPYADLFKAYCFDREFKKLIDSGQFVFTDRHLVLNNEKYIARNQAGNATLSEYALTHMDECCVVFSKGYSYQSKYQGVKYYTQFMRNAAPVENQVEYSFELNTHNRTLLDQIQNAKRRSEALRKYPGSFAETLVALQKERKLSNKQLADRSLVGEKTIQRLRNDEEYPTSVQTVLALCVGLKLPLPEAEMFLGKTDFKLNSLKGEGFTEKKTMQNGFDDSGIRMNTWIAKKNKWTLAELEERSEYLMGRALSIWAAPVTEYKPEEKQLDTYTLEDENELTGRLIAKFTFKNTEQPVTSWVEMFQKVIQILYAEDKAIITKLAMSEEENIALHFNTNPDAFTKSVEIGDGIYVWTNTSTQSKLSVLSCLFKLYNEDPSDLVFYLRDENEANEDEPGSRYELRRKYWTCALPIIQKAHGEDGSFSNVNPSRDNWLNGSFGIGGFYLCCVANYDAARAEVVFGRGNKQENKDAFDSLYTHKAEIESALGTTLQWNRGDDIKSSKVFIQLNNVSIENETDWLQMANFHADWTKKFYDVIVPFIKG